MKNIIVLFYLLISLKGCGQSAPSELDDSDILCIPFGHIANVSRHKDFTR